MLNISLLALSGMTAASLVISTVTPASPSCTAMPTVPLMLPGGTTLLGGVAATSMTDVWAAGFFEAKYRRVNPVTEHFDGRSWAVVPAAQDPILKCDALSSVAVWSASDAWAGGVRAACFNAYEKPLAEHWDGSAWREVALPAYSNEVNGFASIAIDPAQPTDVWAAGTDGSYGTTSSREYGLAMHWNGKHWKSYLLSGVDSTAPYQLYGITVTPTGHAWAVGTGGNNGHAVIYYWNGSVWTRVPAPSPANSSLFSVSAISDDDVWTVGAAGSKPFALHFDGSRWSYVGPRPLAAASWLRSVIEVSPTSIWAVGGVQIGQQAIRPLLVHSSGHAFDVEPSIAGDAITFLSSVAPFGTGIIEVGSAQQLFPRARYPFAASIECAPLRPASRT